MWELNEQLGMPDDFAGVARLFPLPNLVMFPHVVQQLHIFEPRYVDMLHEALDGDRLITMVLLKPGWEKSYEERPPVARIACVGRVMVHAENEKGTHNLMLLGLGRATIDRELDDDASFRRAQVGLLQDDYPSESAAERPALQRQLLDRLRQFVPSSTAAQEQFEQLIGNPLPLGPLTDILASTLGLPLEAKQGLLAECNVDRRANLLLGLLDGGGKKSRPFPPQFSSN